MKLSNSPIFKMATVLFFLVMGLLLYAAKDPLTAVEQSAYQAMKPALVQKGDYYSLRPDGDVTGGVIIFPDSKEDPASYAPMAQKLAEQGLEIRVVKYPLGIQALSGAERKILDDRTPLPWVSLGFGSGVEKACILADQSDQIAGLIMAGVCTSQVNLNDNDIQVTVYQLADKPYPADRLAEVRRRLPADTEFITVEDAAQISATLPGGQPEGLRRYGGDSLAIQIQRVLANRIVNLRNKK